MWWFSKLNAVRDVSRLFSFIILTSAAPAGWACGTADAMYTFRMPPVVSVKGASVKLADLVLDRITLKNTGVANLAVAKLGEHREIRISRRSVANKIRQHSKPLCFRLLGPDYIVIKKTLPRQRLVSISSGAAEYLRQRIEDLYNVRDLQVLAMPSNTLRSNNISDSNIKIDYRLEPNSELKSKMTVWLDLFDEGVLRESVPLDFSVKGQRQVLILNHGLEHTNQFDWSHVSKEYEPIDQVNAKPLLPEDIADNMRYAYDVRGGQFLRPSMLEPVPAVVRGGFVVIKVVKPRISIEALAVSLNDGNVGELVTVRSASSQELYKARVLNKNLAIAQR